MTETNQSDSESESELVFETSYLCENCGAEWDKQYPARTVIRDDERVETYNKDCDRFGMTACDCCTLVSCPVCELVTDVAVADRSPLTGDQDD